MRKKPLIVGFAFVLSLLMSCSLAFADANKGAKEPIKIGVITAASGKYTPLGQGNITAINLGAKILNKEGGVLGRPVEIVFHDGEALPDKSTQLAKKLILEDKVVAIIGCASVVASFAISNVANNYKIVQAYCAPQTSIWKRGDKIYKYSFPTAFGNGLDALAISKYLEKLGIKRVAIFHDSNQYGTEGANLLAALLKKNGKIKIVSVEKYQKSDRDLTAVLSKIKINNPQALVIWGTMPTPPIIAKNMKQIGMNIPIIGSQGACTPAYMKVAGSAAEGTVFTSPLNYGKILPHEQFFYKAYQAEYGKPPSPFAAHGWDAFWLVIESIKKAKSTDPQKMQRALENLKNYKGVMGTFNFSPANHDGLSLEAVDYVKVKDGKWVPVN